MKKTLFMMGLVMLGLFVTACSGNNEVTSTKDKYENHFVPAKAGTYDSADTAVIVNIDTEQKNITFLNLIREKNYTLNYDGTSKLYDKYGESLSMQQVKEGDIVDVTFLKQKKHLNSLQMSPDAFSLEDVSKFEIQSRKKQISVADSMYKFEDELLIFSDGKSAQLMDINQADCLNIKGIGNTVYSISISKGHGYLRLKNDEYFWGGWIEVGGDIIRTISEDMLLVVPEGTYDVTVSVKGAEGTKKVTIERDKETELDIGDLKNVEEKKYGTLIFSITPETATLFIDGEEADYSGPIQAEYGIHQLLVQAEGYDSIARYIRVGQESATLQITMEKEDTDSGNSKDKDDDSASDNDTEKTSSEEPTSSTTPSSSSTETESGETDSSSEGDSGTITTTGPKVSIDAPSGVEVYVDGNYVGIAPISFGKKEGPHVITLRKDGYQTRSYTIDVDGTDMNASFSFSDLVPED